MKMYWLILLLALVTPAMAAEIDSKLNLNRYVADDLEIATLPNGEIVTRLVSRSGLTARQFWVDSVYQRHESILVFQSKDGLIQNPGAAQGGPTGERRISQNDRVPNDMPGVRHLVPGLYTGWKEGKGLSQVAEQGK